MVEQPAIWELAIFMNGLMLATNLLPITFTAGFRSDGRMLLTIPFAKDELFADALVLDLLLDAQNAIEKHDFPEARRCVEAALTQHPNSVGARMTSATIDMETGNLARAREQLVELSALKSPEATTLSLANNLAWADFLTDDPAHHAEADDLSAGVIKKFGSAGFALGTRGAVLVWIGKTDEG